MKGSWRGAKKARNYHDDSLTPTWAGRNGLRPEGTAPTAAVQCTMALGAIICVHPLTQVVVQRLASGILFFRSSINSFTTRAVTTILLHQDREQGDHADGLVHRPITSPIAPPKCLFETSTMVRLATKAVKNLSACMHHAPTRKLVCQM